MSYPIDLNDFQYNQAQWSNKTFVGQELSGKFAHLRKEVDELEADPRDIMEYADCYSLLVDIAAKNNIFLSDIHYAAIKKLEINKKRKWGKPNADGSVEHTKTKNQKQKVRRYEIRIGKFGTFYHDTRECKDLTLNDVLSLLNQQ